MLNKKDYKCYLQLTVAVLLAIWLRLIGLNKENGLWFDEMVIYIQSVQSFPFGIINHIIRSDILMPLHQLCLHLWMLLFRNDADIILRLFSVLTGVLSVIAIYLTGNIMKDKKTGVIAAFLAAVNACAIYYSQEVKFYSMLMFATSLNLFFFFSVLKNQNKKGWVGLVVANLIGCYTFSAYFILTASQFVLLVFDFIRSKKNPKAFAISSVVLGVLLIPCVYFLVFIAHGQSKAVAPISLSLQFDASTWFFLAQNWFTPMFKNMVANIVNYFPGFFAVYRVGEVNLIFTFLGLNIFLMIYALFKDKEAKRLGALYFIFACFLGLATIFTDFVLTTRYGLILIPCFIVLQAIGIKCIKNRILKRIIFFILVVVPILVALLGFYSAPKANRNGLKPLGDMMQVLSLKKTDLVVTPLDYSVKNLTGKYYSHEGLIINTPTLIYNPAIQKLYGIKTGGDQKEAYKNYLISDEITKEERDIFRLNVTEALPKGSYVFVVENVTSNEVIKRMAKENYKNPERAFWFLPPDKFIAKFLMLCHEKLTFLGTMENMSWKVFIFKTP